MENVDINKIEKQAYSIFTERRRSKFTHITIQSNIEIDGSIIKGRTIHKNAIIYTNKNDHFEFSIFDVVKVKYSSCIAAGFRDLLQLSITTIIIPLILFMLMWDSFEAFLTFSKNINNYLIYLFFLFIFIIQIHWLKFKTIQFVLRNGKKINIPMQDGFILPKENGEKIHIPMHGDIILFKEKRNDNWFEFLEVIKKLGINIF